MSELGPDALRALPDTAVVELAFILEAVSDEPVVLRLAKVNRGKELFTFDVFYFDIPLGQWVAKIQAESDVEKVIWAKNEKA